MNKLKTNVQWARATLKNYTFPFKRNFKWPSMQRWKCPIYNGTLMHVNFVYLICSFWFVLTLQKWLTQFLIRYNGEIHRNKNFLSQKNDVSSTLLIRLRFQGYRCKSGTEIFAWRVMKAYTPFNMNKFLMKERKIRIFFEDKIQFKLQKVISWKRIIIIAAGSRLAVSFQVRSL